MALLTHLDCMAAYGAPELERGMTLWDVPSHLEIGAIPKRLYCSRLIIAPLVMAFDALSRRIRKALL